MVWLQGMEGRLAGLGPIGTDVDSVKRQLDDLKEFKELVHPKHLDIQSLNQQAHDLTRDSPTEQATAIREPMTDVNKRWDALIDGISDRKVRFHSQVEQNFIVLLSCILFVKVILFCSYQGLSICRPELTGLCSCLVHWKINNVKMRPDLNMKV